MLRKIHKYLGVVIAAQLLIWTLSGLFFSVIPIEQVRGGHLIEPPAAFRLGHLRMLAPSALAGMHPQLSDIALDQIQILQRLNTPIYLIQTSDGPRAFDAESGAALAPLSEVQVGAVVANQSKSRALGASYVEEVEAGSEYRDGELPAWRVELDGGVNLWIGAYSGQVRAVRTPTWRVYDWLWSLHIMDYWQRDNFSSWLLRVCAVLGLLAVVSGIAMFVVAQIRGRKVIR